MNLLPIVLRGCSLLTIAAPYPIFAEQTIPSAYREIARDIGVKADILYALALAESGHTYQRYFRPWPWTLNIEGRSYRFTSRSSAYQKLKKTIAQEQSVDVGLMQVNWYWHGDKFGDVWDALDPMINVNTGAAILLAHYQRTQDWWLAVEKYHAPGRDKKSLRRAKRYRQRVFRLWKQLKQGSIK